MNRNGAAAVALASWTAAVLCRFRARGPGAKAPEDWRSPRPGSAAFGSWRASVVLRARAGTVNRCRSRKQTLRPVGATQTPTAGVQILQFALGPAAKPIQRRKYEVRRRTPLPSHQFRAAAHVVDHPRGQRQMIGV